jgi:uncharacterized repeat protein (TIGR01451 family)
MAIAGAMSALALLAIAPAFAGIGGSVVPDFQSPINVGQILTASIFITNNSTPNNDNESMKVTNIFVTPSCSAVTNGVCTGIDKDVFTIESVIGDPFDTNSTCKNLAFNVGPEDANGQFQLIPNNVSQSVTLGPSSGSTNYCNIQLNLSVNKAPVDSTPGTPNTRTTVSLAHAKMQGATTGLSATATGGSISVVTTPNLQIVKTPKEQVISAGDVASFTVLVDNTAGAGDATNVKLTDNLPNVAGLNWQISPPVAGCNVGGSNPQVLSCTTLLVPAGQSVNLIVSAQTSPAACPPMSNTAQITGYNNLTLQQPLSDTGSLSCSQGPALNKAFGPATFADGGVSTLTFTVTNPASNNPAQVVSFTDTLPTGLKIAANPNVQQTCTGGSITANAGATTITASAVTVAASTGVASSCTVKVDVTNVSGQFNGSCASFAAAFTNQGAANPPSNISGLSNLTDAVTRSCVVVNATPSLNKAFGPTTIADGGTSTLTFTVTNPASNNGAQAVSFTDALPSGLKIAATPNVQKTCTGGSVTANSGATTITVSGVTVAASTGVGEQLYGESGCDQRQRSIQWQLRELPRGVHQSGCGQCTVEHQRSEQSDRRGDAQLHRSERHAHSQQGVQPDKHRGWRYLDADVHGHQSGIQQRGAGGWIHRHAAGGAEDRHDSERTEDLHRRFGDGECGGRDDHRFERDGGASTASPTTCTVSGRCDQSDGSVQRQLRELPGGVQQPGCGQSTVEHQRIEQSGRCGDAQLRRRKRDAES